MIPSDHITFNDDGTVWLVEHRAIRDSPALQAIIDANHTFKALDRPCDECDGTLLADAWVNGPGDVMLKRCLECDSTGRHTFTIEVASHICNRIGPNFGKWEARTLRVHVVPGMVREIVDQWQRPDAIIWSTHHHVWCIPGTSDQDAIPVPLPATARPGMWAALLALHNPST